MLILPGSYLDTPFYKYRATGKEICEKCLFLDLVCFPVEEAIEIERGLSCSCPHIWTSYTSLNNTNITDHVKMGWSVGLSASGIPCPSLCPSDLLKLVKEEKEIERIYQIEREKINSLCNGPDRSDIAPDEITYFHNVKLSEAETYIKVRRKYFHAQGQVRNYIENLIRETHGLPRVGERWVNETRLFHIVESIFPDDEVIHHYRASWLGRLELDVYVVGANIGFEYQGIQHYEPQEHWGGHDALICTQKRDAEKARKCIEHGTRLIEIFYNEDLTESLVREKLSVSMLENDQRVVSVDVLVT